MTLTQPHDEKSDSSSTVYEKPRYKYERLGINMHPVKMAVAAVIVALVLISITGCTESQNTTQCYCCHKHQYVNINSTGKKSMTIDGTTHFSNGQAAGHDYANREL